MKNNRDRALAMAAVLLTVGVPVAAMVCRLPPGDRYFVLRSLRQAIREVEAVEV